MKNDHGSMLVRRGCAALLLLAQCAIADEKLTDAVNSYPIAVDWSQGWRFLGYFLLFAAGFAAAWYLDRVSFRRERVSGPSADLPIEAIRKSDDPREILKHLLRADRKAFASQIAQLERAVYGGEALSLTQIKREIAERSRDDAKG